VGVLAEQAGDLVHGVGGVVGPLQELGDAGGGAVRGVAAPRADHVLREGMGDIGDVTHLVGQLVAFSASWNIASGLAAISMFHMCWCV
jgi:hypothetical protein